MISGTGFSSAERDLMALISQRQYQILRKLAFMIGNSCMGMKEHRIDLAEFIGKGFDDRDIGRIIGLVASMKGIIEEARQENDMLVLRFMPEAISLVRKFALQEEERPASGKGVAYCNAALALKRAFGIRTDVCFCLEFDRENFNYGENISYMDHAFNDGDPWRLSFEERIGEYLEREVIIGPLSAGRVYIGQTFSCIWPGRDYCRSDELGCMEGEVFANPELLADIIPAITEKAGICQNEAMRDVACKLEVKFPDGTSMNKPEILQIMKAACRKEDRLCKILGVCPEVRQSPEWPLGEEPKAFFRELSCDLENFKHKYLDSFKDFEGYINGFINRLWLHLFNKKYDSGMDEQEQDGFGRFLAIYNLQERYPERVEELEPEFNRQLGKAQIRIAWGLATRDFTEARGFAQAILFHPVIGEMKIGQYGLSITCKIEPDAMAECLDHVERLVLGAIGQ